MFTPLHFARENRHMKSPEYPSHNFIQWFLENDYISREPVPVDRSRTRPFSRSTISAHLDLTNALSTIISLCKQVNTAINQPSLRSSKQLGPTMGKDKWLRKCLEYHLARTVEEKFPYSLWLSKREHFLCFIQGASEKSHKSKRVTNSWQGSWTLIAPA